MKKSRAVLGAAALSALILGTGSLVPAHAMRAGAACSALGSYTILANGTLYASSAPFVTAMPLVVGGSARITAYSGCGTPTAMQINSDGVGTRLNQPVTALIGNQLRSSGDLLLHFSGSVKQDKLVPQSTQAVVVSGVATFARVTTKGVLHGKQKLSYSVKTVKIANVRGQLRVDSAFGGAFSLSIALPGPTTGKVASSFAYFAVGAKNPAAFKAAKKVDSNL